MSGSLDLIMSRDCLDDVRRGCLTRCGLLGEFDLAMRVGEVGEVGSGNADACLGERGAGRLGLGGGLFCTMPSGSASQLGQVSS